VAALIVDARAAREEAQRVRLASVELRLAVRRSNRLAHVRKEKAVAAAAASRRRVLIFPSPWSGLYWRREDDEVDRTLVPLD
jgi:hypothetical protein